MTIKPNLIALLAIVLLPALLAAQILEYTIEPQFSPSGEMTLQLDLQCYAASQDTVWFRLPDKINWSTGLWRCYDEISTSSDSARVQRLDSLRLIILRPSGQTAVHLRYRLRQTLPGNQVTRAHSLGPVLQPDFLQVPGECLFLTPRHYRHYDVRVEWKNLPAGWQIQSNWASGETRQRIQTTSVDWRNGVWVAGDFRILHGMVFDKPVYLAIRGNWNFTDQSVFQAILRTVETQRDQWNDRDIPYYSVTLLPLVDPTAPAPDDQHREILGYGQFQSFAVYAGRLATAARLIRLFNHEMMHDWIGGKIRDCPPYRSDALNWFAEGFTDYYALRNRWKSGFMDQADFFLEWNDRVVSLHYADPLGELPETTLRDRRYDDDRAFKVPYRRGAILAFYFDCAIRRQTNNTRTLHDFMLELLDYTYGSDKNLLEHFDFFTETLETYLGHDPASFLETHATGGARIPPEAFWLPDFLRMETDAAGVPQFHLNPDDPDAAAKFLK